MQWPQIPASTSGFPFELVPKLCQQNLTDIMLASTQKLFEHKKISPSKSPNQGASSSFRGHLSSLDTNYFKINALPRKKRHFNFLLTVTLAILSWKFLLLSNRAKPIPAAFHCLWIPFFSNEFCILGFLPDRLGPWLRASNAFISSVFNSGQLEMIMDVFVIPLSFKTLIFVSLLKQPITVICLGT